MSKHKSIQRPGYLSNVARNGSLENRNVQCSDRITDNNQCLEKQETDVQLFFCFKFSLRFSFHCLSAAYSNAK